MFKNTMKSFPRDKFLIKFHLKTLKLLLILLCEFGTRKSCFWFKFSRGNYNHIDLLALVFASAVIIAGLVNDGSEVYFI